MVRSNWWRRLQPTKSVVGGCRTLKHCKQTEIGEPTCQTIQDCLHSEFLCPKREINSRLDFACHAHCFSRKNSKKWNNEIIWNNIFCWFNCQLLLLWIQLPLLMFLFSIHGYGVMMNVCNYITRTLGSTSGRGVFCRNSLQLYSRKLVMHPKMNSPWEAAAWWWCLNACKTFGSILW